MPTVIVTLSEAQNVALGYMSPQNDAMNQLAQRGKVTPEIFGELDAEIALARKEWAGLSGRAAIPRIDELTDMVMELRAVQDYLQINYPYLYRRYSEGE